MGRNVTIAMINATGFDWGDLQTNIEHGKFNQDPPSVVLNANMGVFQAGNRTGALIGPKGSISYSMGSTDVRIFITWDHPFSASTSTYTCYSEPEGKIKATLSPPNPSGHDQEVTVRVRLNDDGFDPASWMSNVKENVNIRNVLIPGSHDSGTYDITPSSHLCLDADAQFLVFARNVGLASQWAKAQSNSILDQLNSGIRYFDIRISDGYYFGLVIKDVSIHNVVGSPVICHSVGVTPPASIFDDVQEFIRSNPKEILILNFQHFYHKQADASDFYADLIGQIKLKFGSKIIDRRTFEQSIENLTMENLRKNGAQVLIVFDQDHRVEKTLSPSTGESFKDVYGAMYSKETSIWSASDFLSNRWPDASDTEKLKTKLDDIVSNHMPGANQLFVLQGVVTPDTSTYLNAISGGLPKSLEELGNNVTPNVESWVLNDWAEKDLNIIMCDWISNSIITQLCYLMNKKKGMIQSPDTV